MPSPFDAIARAAKATRLRTLRDAPQFKAMPATVIAFADNFGGDTFGNVIATVLLDGASRTVQASSTAPDRLSPGDRVMVQHNPPHGFVVTGLVPVGGGVPGCATLFLPFLVGEIWAQTEVPFDTDSARVIDCGFGLAGTGSITQVPPPVRGVYRISCSAYLERPAGIDPDDALTMQVRYFDEDGVTYDLLIDQFQFGPHPAGGWDIGMLNTATTIMTLDPRGYLFVIGGDDPPAAGYEVGGDDQRSFGLTVELTCCTPDDDAEPPPTTTITTV